MEANPRLWSHSRSLYYFIHIHEGYKWWENSAHLWRTNQNVTHLQDVPSRWLSSFYVFGYTLKTKYRNLKIFTFFFSILAIENLQNQYILFFLIISLLAEISPVNKRLDLSMFCVASYNKHLKKQLTRRSFGWGQSSIFWGIFCFENNLHFLVDCLVCLKFVPNVYP